MRHRDAADTDLELIAPETHQPEPLAAPAPTPKRPATPALWLVGAIAAAAVLVAGGLAFHFHDELTVARRSAADLRKQAQHAAPAPITDLAAPDTATTFTSHVESLRGQGRVAIASDGHLRVLDADKQRVLDAVGAFSHPTWSASGHWLSYVVNATEVRVMRADQTDAHEVGIAPVVRPDTVAWSPAADTLALVTRAGLVLAAMDGTAAPPLRDTAGASSVSWSPDGTHIAFTQPDAGKAGLVVLDQSGGGEHVVAHVRTADEDFRLAGWWPDGNGLLAWRISSASASLAADGADLMSISSSGEQTRLTTMLPYRQWLSWSPDRRHVVVVAGGGREASSGKHLAVCDVVAGTCESVAGSQGTVALDPAWSPDGKQIAYVRADDDAGADFGKWLGTRQLWTMKPDGSDATRLGALDGVDAPRWMPDSKQLLVVGGENVLWLVDRTFVAPVASRLYAGGAPASSFYGFVDWSQALAWHAG